MHKSTYNKTFEIIFGFLILVKATVVTVSLSKGGSPVVSNHHGLRENSSCREGRTRCEGTNPKRARMRERSCDEEATKIEKNRV